MCVERSVVGVARMCVRWLERHSLRKNIGCSGCKHYKLEPFFIPTYSCHHPRGTKGLGGLDGSWCNVEMNKRRRCVYFEKRIKIDPNENYLGPRIDL